jgi:hypothetical protein
VVGELFEQKKYSTDEQQRLLHALAEQLKLPLLQISRQAELVGLTNDMTALDTVRLTANSALQLLDNYLLSTRLSGAETLVTLEPVSLSAVLQDTAQRLNEVAGLYQCELELQLAGRYEPVMAHRAGLEAALMSLGYVFIEAQSARPHVRRPVVTLAAHRTRWGIVGGMYADLEGLSADMYRRAQTLYGRARQPLTQLSASNGAGVFVADSLLSSMSTHLRIAHHRKLTGLAATFQPSKQLSLV